MLRCSNTGWKSHDTLKTTSTVELIRPKMAVAITNHFELFDFIFIGELLLLNGHLESAHALTEFTLQLAVVSLHQLSRDCTLCFQLTNSALVFIQEVLHLLLVHLMERKVEAAI